MSSTARFFVITVLIVATLGFGGLIYNLSRPAVAPIVHTVETPAPFMPRFLVAAHPLPAGTLARDDDFVAKPMPPSNTGFADTPEALASLRGSLIRNFLDTGTLITPADALRPRDRGFIASVLREGYRAVAVGVDPISGVAGLIWPGDHVDLLLTQDLGDKQDSSHRALTETILNDVRVIAIDQEMVQGASASNTTVGKLVRTVTLEVAPNQAQIISAGASMGRLSLSIRSAANTTPDRQVAPTYGLDVSPALALRNQPPPRVPMNKSASVTVYSGVRPTNQVVTVYSGIAAGREAVQ
jgi:pilus assembly protein CpaB